MSISPDDIRRVVQETLAQLGIDPAQANTPDPVAEADDDPLERFHEAWAKSFDPPLSAMTRHRWRKAGLIPEPEFWLQGVPWSRRSSRLKALEALKARRDVRESANPAARKAGGA